MGSSINEDDHLWQLLQIVQKLEDTVSHTLTKSTKRRSCMEEMEFRHRRNQLFPVGYFADAAWDILLDLYSAHIKGRRISTTGLGLVGGVPQTTMLRYLDQIVRDGFAVRVNDPRDGRRIFVELTSAGIERMSALFDDEKIKSDENSINNLANSAPQHLSGSH